MSILLSPSQFNMLIHPLLSVITCLKITLYFSKHRTQSLVIYRKLKINSRTYNWESQMLPSHSMNKCRPISTLNVLSALVISGFRFILSVMKQCWLNFSRKYILHSLFAQTESVRRGLCKDRRQNTIRTNRPSSVNKYFIKWLHLQWKRK